MNVILAKSSLAGPISGADEALVRYASHLQRLGLLQSVTLLYVPVPADSYHQRLVAAGITVDVVESTAILRDLLLLIRRLAVRAHAISDVAAMTPTGATHVRQNLPRRAWRAAWQLTSRIHLGRCRRHFARRRPDVIHVIASDAGAAVLIRGARAAGIPVLFHELGTPDHLPELQAHYAQFTSAAGRATDVAALSPHLAAGWRAQFRLPRALRVLPLLYDDEGVRTRERVADGRIVFGFAARLDRGKGLMTLLAAFARVRQQQPMAHLRIGGVGPLAQPARELAARLGIDGSCEFLGYTPERDKRRMMESFDVFVLPSLAEGTPNSLIDAMMLGLPVVATSVGGIPDMFGDTPAALLVPPDDIDALAGAMTRVACDAGLRARLRTAARARYERIHHPDAVLPLLLKEYTRTASGVEVFDDSRASGHPWEVPGENAPAATTLPHRRMARIEVTPT